MFMKGIIWCGVCDKWEINLVTQEVFSSHMYLFIEHISQRYQIWGSWTRSGHRTIVSGLILLVGLWICEQGWGSCCRIRGHGAPLGVIIGGSGGKWGPVSFLGLLILGPLLLFCCLHHTPLLSNPDSVLQFGSGPEYVINLTTLT